MRKFIVLLLFIFFLSSGYSDSAVSNSEIFKNALADFENGKYEESLTHLLKLENEDHLLKDYILLFIAKSYYKLGNFENSSVYFGKLISDYSKSPLVPEALYERALSEFSHKNFSKSLEFLEKYEKTYSSHYNREKALLLLAECYKEQGIPEKELKTYYQLVRNYTDSQDYHNYFGNYEKLLAENPENLKLSQNDKYNFGRDLLRAGRLEYAIKILIRVVNSRGDEQARRLALFNLGVCYFNKKDNVNAENRFKRYIKNYPWSQYSKRAKIYLIRIYDRLNDSEKLYSVSNDILKSYPNSTYYYEALFRTANYQMEFKDFDGAEKKLMKIVKSNNRNWKNDALQKLFWIYFNKGRNKECKDLLKYVPLNSEDRPMFLYWTAQIYQNEGNKKEGERLLKSIIKSYPFTYYGFLAQRKITDFNLSRPVVFPNIKNLDKINNKAIARTRELDNLGLSEYLIYEYKKSGVQKFMNKSNYYYYLARFYSTSGKKFRAYQLIDLYFKRFLVKNSSNIPQDLWEIAYPSYLLEKVTSKVEKYSIDPFLILALIRQESFFEENAISLANAIGLMQIMPDMVNNHRKYTRNDLFDVDINLDIGIRNFYNILKRFNNKAYLAIASHNAGVKNVEEWLGRLNYKNDEEFIEQIPFRETRNFVKRVLTGYYQYKRIYEKRASVN